MKTSAEAKPRRRYNYWLEDQVMKREAKIANEVQRLWALSDRGIATSKEVQQLEKAQKRLGSLTAQLRVIRSTRAHAPVRK